MVKEENKTALTRLIALQCVHFASPCLFRRTHTAYTYTSTEAYDDMELTVNRNINTRSNKQVNYHGRYRLYKYMGKAGKLRSHSSPMVDTDDEIHSRPKYLISAYRRLRKCIIDNRYQNRYKPIVLKTNFIFHSSLWRSHMNTTQTLMMFQCQAQNQLPCNQN